MQWAKQGVLLLNVCLTVRAHQANSHAKQGWEQFTDAAIGAINRKKKNVVFLLWGKSAENKAKGVDRARHHVLIAAHPSGLSANRVRSDKAASVIWVTLDLQSWLLLCTDCTSYITCSASDYASTSSCWRWQTDVSACHMLQNDHLCWYIEFRILSMVLWSTAGLLWLQALLQSECILARSWPGPHRLANRQ